MRNIVITRHGGPEVLQIREARDPFPGLNEVRIAVEAIGVNFADILLREGVYPDAPRLPAVIGYEVAGVIDAVGAGVQERHLGDRVFALTHFGGYSTSVVVPAAHAIPVLPRFNSVQSAAIPVNYLTAFLALYKLGNLASGETVLVHGAGGGVGIAALQLAHVRDARIIGTASTAKHEAIRRLGVEHLIDPSRGDVPEFVRGVTGGRGVDVILDAIGGRHFVESYGLLAPLGRLVLFGAASALGSRRNYWQVARTLLTMPSFRSMRLINDNRGVLGLNLGRLWSEEDRIALMMSEIMGYFADGRLQPVISRVFPFEQAAEGHRWLQSRSNIGKVVLTTF